MIFITLLCFLSVHALNITDSTQNLNAFPAAKLLQRSDAPLRTKGRYIVDKKENRVKWACVAWYGPESLTFAANGLERKTMKEIATRIRELGFNCVRLPYSIEGLVKNPEVKKEFLIANPQLFGKRWHEIFDATVEALTDVGLMVIIDNHVSKAGWCCFAAQEEGLWYQADYPEELWIQSLENITDRYRSNPLVVAIELRNELHDWASTYLTWGSNDSSTDWYGAASRAAKRVQQMHPDILIVVEALCFGMELRGIKKLPIELPIANRVVYAVHSYLEFSVWADFDRHLISFVVLQKVSGILLLVLVYGITRLLLKCRRREYICPSVEDILRAGIIWISCSLFACTIAFLVVWKTACIFCSYWDRNDFYNSMVALVASCILATIICIPAAITRKFFPPRDLGDWQLLQDEYSQKDSEVFPLHGFFAMMISFICVGIVCAFCGFGTSYALQQWFFNRSFGFALNAGEEYAAPVWMGEFAVTIHGTWWSNVIRYLRDNDMDFGYWAINGRKWSEGNINFITGAFDFFPEPRWADDPYGILDSDFHTVRDMWRLNDLQSLMQPSS